MDSPDQRITRSEARTGPWNYWRPVAEGVLELGTVRGERVGLPTHFHREDQVTFVLSGQRRFVIGGEVVVLETGHGTLIPAGVPHRSLSEPHGVLCFNAYVPPAEYAVADLMSAIKRLRLEIVSAGRALRRRSGIINAACGRSRAMPSPFRRPVL